MNRRGFIQSLAVLGGAAVMPRLAFGVHPPNIPFVPLRGETGIVNADAAMRLLDGRGNVHACRGLIGKSLSELGFSYVLVSEDEITWQSLAFPIRKSAVYEGMRLFDDLGQHVSTGRFHRPVHCVAGDSLKITYTLSRESVGKVRTPIDPITMEMTWL